MTAETAYVMAKRLGGEIARILSEVDLQEYDTKTRTRVHVLRRELDDVHVEVRDYELAETRTEQQKFGYAARKRLFEIEASILALSQHNLFGPVAVAELSARIDMLRQELS